MAKKNPTPPTTYEVNFAPKFVFSECETIAECIKAADAQTQELRKLQALGFTMEDDGNTEYPRFVTTDTKAAHAAVAAGIQVEYDDPKTGELMELTK